MGVETSKNQGLTNKEIAVLKANTKLNETEIRKTYDEFISENPSGKINKAQFRKLYQKIADPTDKNSGLADKIFPLFDTNGDGTINFSEFAVATAMMNKNDLDSGLELAFGLIDSSGDGSISFNEMVKFFEFATKLSDEIKDTDAKMMATLVFGMFDIDRSQKLSKKQFMDGVKTNKDLKDMFSGFSS